MYILPQTPLDWVLIAVAVATAIVIAVAMQDFFVDTRVSSPRIRAFQDLGVGLAVTQFGVLLLRGSAGPNWAIAGIATYVIAARREEKLLEARFGEAYRTYKRGAGMLVPSLVRLFTSFIY